MSAPDSTELDELVARTEGAQPLRRLFHAFTGTAVAATLTWLISPETALLLLGGAFLLLLGLDLARLQSTAANTAFFRVFGRLASPREAEHLASSTWYALGLLLAVALFPLPLAISGVLVLALADPAASYLGRRFGRRPFLGGSLEGSLIFLTVAALVLLLRHPGPEALIAAVGATLVERLSWPADDNLTLPPATAALLLLAQRLL